MCYIVNEIWISARSNASRYMTKISAKSTVPVEVLEAFPSSVSSNLHSTYLIYRVIPQEGQKFVFLPTVLKSRPIGLLPITTVTFCRFGGLCYA